MKNCLPDRVEKLREFFDLKPDVELIPTDEACNEIFDETAEQLARFNIEWHVIPTTDAVPLDNAYMTRLYPMAAREFSQAHGHGPSCRAAITAGHQKHQGRIIGVETTMKPRYMPNNRQYYGTPNGFCASADPFASYLGRAGLTNATRYGHHYTSLRTFVNIVNDDWRARKMLPTGYRFTICPPLIFNLIGNVFHPEWAQTETLELGFYRDERGNAVCFVVGGNAPGDFSYISGIDLESDWTLAGFRAALVPE